MAGAGGEVATIANSEAEGTVVEAVSEAGLAGGEGTVVEAVSEAITAGARGGLGSGVTCFSNDAMTSISFFDTLAIR